MPSRGKRAGRRRVRWSPVRWSPARASPACRGARRTRQEAEPSPADRLSRRSRPPARAGVQSGRRPALRRALDRRPGGGGRPVVDAAAPARQDRRLPIPRRDRRATEGGALVGCRFDPGLRADQRDAAGGFRASRARRRVCRPARAGWWCRPTGRLAYVASPPLRGIAVVSLDDGRVLQTVPTGISPRALRLVPKYSWPGRPVRCWW